MAIWLKGKTIFMKILSVPSPKKESPPLLYREVYSKLLDRSNGSDIEKYIDATDLRYCLGSLFHIKKNKWLLVLREMESYGLIEVNLRAKKWRIRLA